MGPRKRLGQTIPVKSRMSGSSDRTIALRARGTVGEGLLSLQLGPCLREKAKSGRWILGTMTGMGTRTKMVTIIMVMMMMRVMVVMITCIVARVSDGPIY